MQARASRTAEFMALFRALETRRPPAVRLFDDPFAYGFLGPGLRAAVHLAGVPGVGALVPRTIDRRWPGARTSGVARTRLIDDALAAAVDGGVAAVVILGAGYDCRAYRLPRMARVRVLEVDHPATQAAKRERLARSLGRLPEHVTFAAVDFDRESLGDALGRAGFDRGAGAFFIWEGVTNYLSADAVDGTLRFVATARAGSRIVFTYVHRGVLDGSPAFGGTTHLDATLRRSGEPWTFGLEPAALPAWLEACGLELIDDLGAAEYRTRYLGRPMTGYEFYRVAVADVRGV